MDGVIGKVLRKAGIPVSRTTALEMQRGLKGWEGREVPLDAAEETDLMWWTWRNRPDRPHGHVGALLYGLGGTPLGVTHASGTQKRVVFSELEGRLSTDISSIKRLRYLDSENFRRR
jgi:hypothetical protein